MSRAFPFDVELSPRDLKAFKRDGVVCLRNVIDAEEIKALRTDVAQQMVGLKQSSTAYDFEDLARQVWTPDGGVVAGNIDVGKADRFDISDLQMILDYDEAARPIRELSERNASETLSANGDGKFFYDAAGWRFYEGIRSVALDSSLPSLTAQLLESTTLNFWEDTTFVKAPLTPQRTTFHQDYGYFQISGSKCCIVWIPLDPVTEETGSMEYIRGSHHWQEAYAPNVLISQSSHPLSPFDRLPDIEANRSDYDIISFDVEPGDVIIHHVMTVHGSRGNMSKNQVRRAVSLRYCGDDIVYCDRPGAMVQPYLIDKPDEGAPLYSKDYPLVWPRVFPSAKLSSVFKDEKLEGELVKVSTFTPSDKPKTWEQSKRPEAVT